MVDAKGIRSLPMHTYILQRNKHTIGFEVELQTSERRYGTDTVVKTNPPMI